MPKPAGAVAISNTGQAEAHILAGEPVTVTQLGRPVAVILPFRRTMTDEEEARLLETHAQKLAAEARELLEDQ